MTRHTAAGWNGDQGQRWRDHLRHFEATLAPVNQPLFDALELPDDAPEFGRIAEVGSGGGGATIALAQRAPEWTVDGFDISPDLVAAATQRTDAPRVQYRVADAATQRAATPYDRLFSRFGVMFFDDADTAFSNLHAWLKPGGRFAFAVWGPIDMNAWTGVVLETVRGLVDVPSKAPDSPGPYRYADVGPFVATLKRAQFAVDPPRLWQGVVPMGHRLNAAQAAGFALSAFSFGQAVAGDATLYERAVDHLTEALAPYEKNGVVEMQAAVHIVTGTRA